VLVVSDRDALQALAVAREGEYAFRPEFYRRMLPHAEAGPSLGLGVPPQGCEGRASLSARSPLSPPPGAHGGGNGAASWSGSTAPLPEEEDSDDSDDDDSGGNGEGGGGRVQAARDPAPVSASTELEPDPAPSPRLRYLW